MRRGVAVHDVFALLDEVAFLDGKVLTLGDQILHGLHTLLGRNDADAALVLVVAAEFDAARDLRDDRVILGTPGLEELGNTRQTAGDVTRLRTLERDTGQHVTGSDLGTRINRENGINRQQVAGFATTGELLHLAVLALDDDRGLQRRTALVRAPVDDDTVGDAGGFVRQLGDRHAFDHVLELHRAVDFRHQRAGVGVPLGNARAALHLVALVGIHARAVEQLVNRALRAVIVDENQRGVAAHDHQAALPVLREVPIADDDLAVRIGFDEAVVQHLRGAADVEGTHGELGARLADRLRRDDAHGFAHVDGRAAREVTAIALGADAELGLTR